MSKPLAVDDIKIIKQEENKQNQPIISYDWILEPDGPEKIHGLALGNYIFAQNLPLLEQNKISAVISVFGETELKLDSKINHFRILIGDNPQENIKCFFDSSIKFITQNIKKTNVLVHCKAGVSRSSTIVAAYLMKTKQMNHHEAIKFLRSKRAIVDPNRGFIRQLRVYERELREQKERDNCLCY